MQTIHGRVVQEALAVLLGVLLLSGLMASPGRAAGPHRYTLIDLGTLGGPQSSTSEAQARVLNMRGTVVGGADTSTPNPSASNPCFLCNPNLFVVSHAVAWRGGVVTDLGALPGANSSFAVGVTDSGVVVGWSSDNAHPDPLLGVPQMHAVLWRSGAMLDLGTLGGGYESVALAANNESQVVGLSANLVPDPFGPLRTQNRLFLWQNGAMEDLGTLGGPDAGALDLVGVVSINERGQVAACSYANAVPNAVTGTPTLDPYLWQHGSMRDLGTLGGTSGCATALNNRGQVAGYSNLNCDLAFHAFVWDGQLRDMGTFGGERSLALGINDAGHVIGRADVTALCSACAPGNQQQLHHPFIWKDGVMTDLGLIAGDTAGTAYSINSKDQVVGRTVQCTHIAGDDSCDAGVVYHAFLWEYGSMFDLQSLIDPSSVITVNNATTINDRGEIARTALLPKGQTHAYLLFPCGEDGVACGT